MGTERYLDVTQSRQTWRIPIIRPDLLEELLRVEPSGQQDTGEYRPSQVELKDGSMCDRVLVAEATSHIYFIGAPSRGDRCRCST